MCEKDTIIIVPSLLPFLCGRGNGTLRVNALPLTYTLVLHPRFVAGFCLCCVVEPLWSEYSFPNGLSPSTAVSGKELGSSGLQSKYLFSLNHLKRPCFFVFCFALLCVGGQVISLCIYYLFICLSMFEAVSHHVALAGLELM